MKYRIGCLSHLKEDDPIFETQDEAEEEALLECKDESAWGIWEFDEEVNQADLLAIAYQDEIFYK